MVTTEGGVSWTVSEAELRRRAEAIVARDALACDAPVAEDALGKLVQELRVHEVELAMQNDELRRGHDELVRTRDAYRDLYQRAPVGYLSLDERGVIVECNLTAAVLLGLSPGGLRKTALSSLMPRADADRLYLHLREVRGGRASRTCEVEVCPVGGGPLHLRLDTIHAEGDGATLFRTTLTDVSERHRLEVSLRELNRDLEQKVEERTAELRLASDRLLTARKMEAVGRLAGGIAHDFNNLLTVIELQLDHVRERTESEPLIASLDAAAQAARIATELTAKLLAFARRGPTSSQPCQPGRVVADLGSMLRELTGERIAMTTNVDDDAGWIAVDRAGLEQLVVNLAVNARDAITGPGEVALDVRRIHLDAGAARALREGRPGDFVRISVRDTGCGMDATTIEQLFEPFFTTKDRARGTGFGLATVYGLVAQAAGFIDVDSEVGRGTTVRVYLPRIEDVRPPMPARTEDVPRGTETVLLVDDDRLVRAATRLVLKSGGYTVVEAGHGREALALLAECGAEIQLVVSDVVMPEMTGTELARHLASSHPALPVILMSGYQYDDPHATAVPCLQKPFAPGALLRAVRTALDASVTAARA